MKSNIQSILIVMLLSISANGYADNTIAPEYPYYPPSSTWVEEDYFTQQEKYCEVDSIYGKQLEYALDKQQSED
ncbi:MAG: hypothetical protein Rsou_1149 [Candidatus Ruthia sp. Asou_11_S2]|nr:hypothetical protein [Candidatus Ruthia sp. Asou_11_S2]